MARVQRYAVSLIMLVFLEFALSSHNYRPDFKKIESVKQSNKESDRLQYRQKRVVTLAIVAGVAGIISAVFGIGKGIYGLIKGEADSADTDAKLSKIQMSLDEVKQKMAETRENLVVLEHNLLSLSDQLSESLSAIQNDHRWLRGATMYSDAVNRLNYILHTLSQFSVDNATGSLQPASDVQRWAEGVTSMSGRSVGEVLYSIHDMVMGTTTLFGNTPLITLVNNTLDPTDSDYGVKLQMFANYTFNLQIAGYFAWITAENVLDRSNTISQIQQLVQQRFQEQSLIISLMTAWPGGIYSIPLLSRSTGCPSPSIAWRFGRESCIRKADEQVPAVYRGSGIWPEGSYCIYPYLHSEYGCPSGLERGDYHYKLKQSTGHYINITTFYCCRSDGSPQTGIFLPPLHTFTLIRKGGQCQKVANMRVDGSYTDYNWIQVTGSGSRPDFITGRLFLCDYTPLY